MRNKKFIGLALLLAFIAIFLPAAQVRAQTTLLPFAGIVSYTTECTCSGTLYIWFAPLYLGGSVVVTGPMIYSPYSTILYAYYNIGVPGLWHLGDYIPGAQTCWIYVGTACAPLPADGLMSKVGTNYPAPQAP